MRVLTYTSNPGGILANAYLVETREGIVAVDATLTVSDARAFRALLDSLGRPLLAVLLTHGHPDHYNGATILVEGSNAPVIATKGVDRVIREWDERKEQQWKGVFGDEWPARRTFPNRTVRDGERLVFGEVSFAVHDVGPGESHHDAYWVASDGATTAVFIGDVVFHGEHAYVSDGHTGAWLENLARIRKATKGATIIYPGHGAPGGAELFDLQRSYLEAYRATVRGLLDGKAALSDDDKQTLTDAMTAFLPAGTLTFLVANGADAVAAELRSA